MHYKTIALELIRERPRLHERLRSTKMLLTAMEVYAAELKADHEARKGSIAIHRPGDPSQVAAEALELAIRDLRDRLPSESEDAADAPLSLDATMDYLRRHTPAE